MLCTNKNTLNRKKDFIKHQQQFVWYNMQVAKKNIPNVTHQRCFGKITFVCTFEIMQICYASLKSFQNHASQNGKVSQIFLNQITRATKFYLRLKYILRDEFMLKAIVMQEKVINNNIETKLQLNMLNVCCNCLRESYSKTALNELNQ